MWKFLLVLVTLFFCVKAENFNDFDTLQAKIDELEFRINDQETQLEDNYLDFLNSWEQRKKPKSSNDNDSDESNEYRPGLTELKDQLAKQGKQLEMCQSTVASKEQTISDVQKLSDEVKSDFVKYKTQKEMELKQLSTKYDELNSTTVECSETCRPKPKPSSRVNHCLQYVNFKGYYEIQVPGWRRFKGYCNSDWEVVQRRNNAYNTRIYDWSDYKEGFGARNSDYFIGLKKLYATLNSMPHELLIYQQDLQEAFAYGHYTNFSIGGIEESYALKTLGDFSGNLPDLLRKCLGKPFKSYSEYQYQFPFSNCNQSNTKYFWFTNPSDDSYKSSIMMIRPLD